MALQDAKVISAAEFQPRNTTVLVKPQAIESTEVDSKSGIVVGFKNVNQLVNRPGTGTIVAVGNKVEDLKPGMVVFYENTAGVDVEFTDGNYVFMDEERIKGYKKV